jgi:hypothetical protein
MQRFLEFFGRVLSGGVTRGVELAGLERRLDCAASLGLVKRQLAASTSMFSKVGSRLCSASHSASLRMPGVQRNVDDSDGQFRMRWKARLRSMRTTAADSLR